MQPDEVRGHMLHAVHHAPSQEWWTPAWITDRLGDFDLDPCAPEGGWVRNCDRYYTKADDGLAQEWSGRVWLNPPYEAVGKWVARLAEHGTGTALVFARTETGWWHSHVWPRASALLFLRGRVSFTTDRDLKGHNSTAPSVLIAYGARDAETLEGCGLDGAFVSLESVAAPVENTP